MKFLIIIGGGMRISKVALFVFLIGMIQGQVLADTIVYRGSSTVGRFMHDAAKVYTDDNFDINTRSESSGGEDAVVAGKADLGGVAREVRPEILGKGVRKYLIGKDAIGILVHPSNPVTRLSIDQLAGMFAGEITRWSEVGGRDLPIDVYITNPRSATRSVVQKKVMGKKAYGGSRIKTIRPDERIIDLVAANPGGLGQLSIAFIKEASVNLIHPDGEAPIVYNPDYPITRNLHLVTNGEPMGKNKQFIDWALSPAGQEIVKYHFIGIR